MNDTEDLSIEPMFGVKEAQEIASIFRRQSKVKSVELFGSLARNGFGDDIDLILIVDEEMSRQFFDAVSVWISKQSRRDLHIYGASSTRFVEALKLLTDDHCNMFSKILDLSYGAETDVFMFPVNWRDRLEEFQAKLPHEDPDFMKNIAKDAREIN